MTNSVNAQPTLEKDIPGVQMLLFRTRTTNNTTVRNCSMMSTASTVSTASRQGGTLNTVTSRKRRMGDSAIQIK